MFPQPQVRRGQTLSAVCEASVNFQFIFTGIDHFTLSEYGELLVATSSTDSAYNYQSNGTLLYSLHFRNFPHFSYSFDVGLTWNACSFAQFNVSNPRFTILGIYTDLHEGTSADVLEKYLLDHRFFL